MLGAARIMNLSNKLTNKTSDGTKRAHIHQPFLRTFFGLKIQTFLLFKPWSHRANGQVMGKKKFYPFVFARIRSMFDSYLVNPLLIRRCLFHPVGSFEHVKIKLTEMSVWCNIIVWLNIRSTADRKSLKLRGGAFCPFFLCNKSVRRFDPAFSNTGM